MLSGPEISSLSLEDQRRYFVWIRDEYAEASRELHEHLGAHARAETEKRRRIVTDDDLYLQGDYERVGSGLAYEQGE